MILKMRKSYGEIFTPQCPKKEDFCCSEMFDSYEKNELGYGKEPPKDESMFEEKKPNMYQESQV